MPDETPLVRRAVRTGGVLLAVAAAQFVAITLIVEGQHPGYNAWTGSVASLTSTSSAWGWMFDGSLIILGILGILGLLFSWSAFDERPSRGVGLLALLVAAGSAACVGGFALASWRLPSNAVTIAIYVAIAGAGVGFLIVASAMHRHERWRVSRAYTLATGLIALASLALYAHALVNLAPGTLERVAAGVALLWGIVEGLHIALLHRFAPGLQVKVAPA